VLNVFHTLYVTNKVKKVNFCLCTPWRRVDGIKLWLHTLLSSTVALLV